MVIGKREQKNPEQKLCAQVSMLCRQKLLGYAESFEEQGMLMIRGNELHVNRLTLDKGEVDIDGRIDSFVYSDTAASGEKQESFFARLFR